MSTEQTDASHKSTLATAPDLSSVSDISVPTASESTIKKVANSISDEHYKFAVEQESYVRHYISFADTKAGFIFGLTSLILVYLINDMKTFSVITEPEWSPIFAITVSSISFIVLSCAFSFFVIAPRTTKINEDIFSFVTVSRRENAATYVSDLVTTSTEELRRARIIHSFDSSVICMQKYSYLKKAIWFGIIGMISTFFLFGAVR